MRYLALVKVAAIISIIIVKSSFAAEVSLLPNATRQLLLVITPSWNDLKAHAYRFERSPKGWKRLPGRYEAVVGSKGLAWGTGLQETSNDGPRKREGDRMAPAGIFPLARAMGYAAIAPPGTSLPYEQINEDSHCVDDQDSRYYNQIVRESDLTAPAASLWGSSERMKRKDDLYKWLIIVDYNRTVPNPGAGSCIFIHVWRSADKGTAGCTALAEQDVEELLRWLRNDAGPVMVQLPRTVYKQYWQQWNLPAPEALGR